MGFELSRLSSTVRAACARKHNGRADPESQEEGMQGPGRQWKNALRVLSIGMSFPSRMRTNELTLTRSVWNASSQGWPYQKALRTTLTQSTQSRTSHRRG